MGGNAWKLIIITVSVTMLLMALTAGRTCAQQVTYSGSMQYTTGSYFFEERTESFSIANGLGWSGERFGISVSLPYIFQNTPWVSYGVSGSIPTGGPQHRALRDSSGTGSGSGSGSGGMKMLAKTKNAPPGRGGKTISLPDTASYNRSSFGDPGLYTNLQLYASGSRATMVTLNTGLKFPFADPGSGFGTGEWDYGVGLSVSRRIRNYFLVADLMKWWFGDLPDLKLKNPLTYSLALGRSLAGGSWLVNANFSGYTEIIEDYDPPMAIGIGIGHTVTQKVSLNGTLSIGLSESSSDVALGIGWNVKL